MLGFETPLKIACILGKKTNIWGVPLQKRKILEIFEHIRDQRVILHLKRWGERRNSKKVYIGGHPIIHVTNHAYYTETLKLSITTKLTWYLYHMFRFSASYHVPKHCQEGNYLGAAHTWSWWTSKRSTAVELLAIGSWLMPELAVNWAAKLCGDANLQIFDLEGVHLGIKTSDNSKHISNICSVSIFKKWPPPPRPNHFFVFDVTRVRQIRAKWDDP